MRKMRRSKENEGNRNGKEGGRDKGGKWEWMRKKMRKTKIEKVGKKKEGNQEIEEKMRGIKMLKKVGVQENRWIIKMKGLIEEWQTIKKKR